MVQIFKPGKKGKSPKSRGRAARSSDGNSNQIETVTIDDLDPQGKGVVRGDKVTFVAGGITGEVCKIHKIEQQKGVREAQLLEVMEASPYRQLPFCPHFQECGGCQTQHIQHDWFVEQKQRAIGASLTRVLKAHVSEPELPWQAPLLSSVTGYRRKARLAVDARKPDDIKLGFRNKQNQVLSLCECQILEPELQSLIPPLQGLVASLKAKKALGHIVFFKGCIFSQQDTKESAVVTFRFTKELTDSDSQLLTEFSVSNQVQVQLQVGEQGIQNLDSKVGDAPDNRQSGYVLHNTVGGDIQIALNPNDFVQINGDINQAMVQRSIEWLQLEEDDRVLDLFCGVGNFTLALASQCKEAIGFEGVPEMVQTARQNAQSNGIDNVRFFSGDLSDETFLSLLQEQNCNKVVLDPARAGALKVMDSLRYLAPERIVYVSCNPATFGRDIAKLLEKSGESNYKNHYQLVKLSLVDMFPNTSHSEIMGLFALRG